MFAEVGHRHLFQLIVLYRDLLKRAEVIFKLFFFLQYQTNRESKKTKNDVVSAIAEK